MAKRSRAERCGLCPYYLERLELLIREFGVDETTPYKDLTILAGQFGNPVQIDAIRLIGQLRYRRAAGLLARLLWETDKLEYGSKLGVLGEASEALARLDTPRSHAALVDLYYRGEDEWTRRFVMDAMGYEVSQIDPKIVIRAIDAAEDPQLQRFALLAVFEQAKFGKFAPYKDAVVRALASPEAYVRVQAIENIGLSLDRRLLHLVKPFVNDEDASGGWSVGRAAREAFQMITGRPYTE